MKSSFKAHIAVLGTNVFFAANFSLVKYISPSLIQPFAVNLLRVGGSLVLFWLLWVAGKSIKSFSVTRVHIKKEHWPRFLLCSLMGIAINQMFFIKGITLTSPIHASLLMLLTPLLITIFAFWVFKEKLTAAKIAGIVLGIAGGVLLISSKELSVHAGNYLLGDIFIFINAASYAAYFILVKPLMHQYPPLHVIRWIFTLGFIMILPFGWNDLINVDWDLFKGSQVMSLVAIIFCGTFLAYYFNIYALRHLGAGITGSYIYTQPFFAAFIAVIFLNETVTFEKIIAAVLIFSGVFLVSFKKDLFNKGFGVIEE